MPAQTRFEVVQVDQQTTAEIEDALNDIARDAGVEEIVDWETVEASRRSALNLVVEYLPMETASGTSAPEAASTHEQKCSLRSASGSSLQSPTTSEVTIQAARSYEMDSMTRSMETA